MLPNATLQAGDILIAYNYTRIRVVVSIFTKGKAFTIQYLQYNAFETLV